MARRKGKAPTFDAMVKFFMQQYNIPTKKDVEKLIARMDRIENLIKATSKKRGVSGRKTSRGRELKDKAGKTAFETVFEVIKKHRNGIGFAEIQAQTGFDDKKIRNVIFRLHKMEKIDRINRGTYIVSR